MRGASRGVREVGQARCPRAGFRTPAPGRPWPAVRRHKDRPPFSGLDVVGTKEGGSPPDRGRRRAFPFRAGKLRRQGQKSRKWSAVRRARPSQGAHRRKADVKWTRRTALHPLALRAGSTKGPGAQPGRSVVECRISGKPDIRGTAPPRRKEQGRRSFAWYSCCHIP